jgi:acyl-homoserine lactone acylase PvdQ
MGLREVFGHSWFRGVAAALALAFALLAPALPAAAAVEPFGAHDAGGFRNVLPPGEAGVDNLAQFTQFQLNGAYPDHWTDQQPLYNGLIYAAPRLTYAQIPQFYKDATFGVRPGQVGSTTTPRPGVTIIRDTRYGVPHIYGDTRSDVMFGAGYANAADRLFLMDILRHTGRAELSSFIGGSPGNRRMDAEQWQLAPYTDQELARQINDAPKFYGAEGRQLVRDAQSYIDGINAYIDAAMSDPVGLMPAEYGALGKLPQKWTTSDLIAEASLIGGIFGRGGGHELDSAQTLRSLVHRFGQKGGRSAWRDFRAKNDPEAPTTILGRRFPYETANSFAKRGLALPDPGTVTTATVVPPVEDRTSSGGPLANIGAELLRVVREDFHASNWELVSARESKTGHPIGVLGPQVGYYLPQILMEEDLHGPTVDARGATFPGVGLFVLLGHGRDYAWSATTATSDNTDTFAEVLCRDKFHYIWRGKCRAMDKLERHNSWTPSGVDMTPPGSETLTAYRTVHGIVFARGKVHGKKVAFVSARTTYGHEADSALFFSRMNNPRAMRHGPKSFRAATKVMNLGFNWSYIDSKHIAYQLTGWYPQRSPGTSPDFPILGTGRFDWKGFNPQRHEADWLPQSRVPHAVDQRYLVSWNNKQAPGWAAADDIWEYSAVHRSQMIADKVAAGTRGARKMSLPALIRAMELPATQDLRALKVLPLALKVIGDPGSAKLRKALARLRHWRKAGAHRRDLDKNGNDEFTAAITLMDAWWPLLVRAEFQPALGKAGFAAVEHMVPLGDHTRRSPDAPAFFDGWWGQATKDLRTVLGQRVPGWSRGYCGGGSRARCRAALVASLRAALKVTPAQLYGFGDCQDDPQPRCFDQNRSIVASGLDIDPQPFQNRPTFQQTVSVTRNLP